MEGPRAVSMQEIPAALHLINRVFRTDARMAPTMGDEFPLLFSAANVENLRAIFEGGEPVSIAGYYQTTIFIEGCPIKAASVGAVCTAPEYRSRNLSSYILDDIEKRLLADGTDVMLISGARGLYFRRGCAIVGGFQKAVLTPVSPVVTTLGMEEFTQVTLPEMARLYNKESTRFYRSLFEFRHIHNGSTVPWGSNSYKTFLFRDKGSLIAYIVLNIIDGESKNGEVVEFAGDRGCTANALSAILSLCNLTKLELYTGTDDPVLQYFMKENACDISEANQLGTVKVINFISFMTKLMPYFRQYTDIQDNDLQFSQDGEKYILVYNGEKSCIQGASAVAQLIFGRNTQQRNDCRVFENAPVLSRFAHNVFPVPFPWVGNLNYI